METYMEHWEKEFYGSFVKEQDRIIREAIKRHGFDPDDHIHLSANFQRVVYPFDDEFEHLFYHHGQRDELRIISIERQPAVDMGYTEINGYKDISSKASITARYY